MKRIEYFGMDLDSKGHFLWTLEDNFIRRSDLRFDQLPFNPEELNEGKANGTVSHHLAQDYNIINIVGSCCDDRGGCKSVFFTKEKLSYGELQELILSIPIAKKIIDKMPFEINW